MSSTPVFTENSASSTERRHHLRGRVSAVAYLDIGTANGGIALNMSEEGMAFQAVGPLDDQTGLTLRIQLPDSRARINTAAQIIWVGKSKRLAGVRFVDLPSEGRVQIQEWIRSQFSPNAPSVGIPESRQVVSQAPKQQDIPQEPRIDKWLTMKARLKEQESAIQTSQSVGEAPEIRLHEPAGQGNDVTAPARESVLGGHGKLATPPNEALRRIEVPSQDATHQLRTAPAQSRPDGHSNRQESDYAATSAPSTNRAGKESAAELPTPISQVVPPAVPHPSIQKAISAEPTTLGVKKIYSRAPVTTRKSFTIKWARVAPLFTSFLILSFAIGAWVGSLGRHVPPDQVSTQPAAVTSPVAKPETSVTHHRKVNEAVSPIASNTSAEHAGRNSEPEALNRKLILPTSPPPTSSLQSNVPSTPPKQSPAPATAADQAESLSRQAPVPDDSGAPGIAPRIVAGQVLKPTDRFNPCHLTYRVEPVYPPEAQQQGIEGAVKIHLLIGADGAVHSSRLLSGSPILAPSALDAANHWQYLPALLNGQPVETEQDIEINFRLPH